jgi:hypothetical protein
MADNELFSPAGLDIEDVEAMLGNWTPGATWDESARIRSANLRLDNPEMPEDAIRHDCEGALGKREVVIQVFLDEVGSWSGTLPTIEAALKANDFFIQNARDFVRRENPHLKDEEIETIIRQFPLKSEDDIRQSTLEKRRVQNEDMYQITLNTLKLMREREEITQTQHDNAVRKAIEEYEKNIVPQD